MARVCERKARKVPKFVARAVAAAQALDFRDFTPGRGTRAAHAAIRRHVEHLDVDRPLHRDHNTMRDLVRRREVLEAVEAEVGELARY